MATSSIPLHRILANFQHRKGWPDSQMAAALGTDVSTYRAWLTGNALPHHTALRRWANVLGGVYTASVLLKRLNPKKNVSLRKVANKQSSSGFSYKKRVRLLSVFAIENRHPVDSFGMGPARVSDAITHAGQIIVPRWAQIDAQIGMSTLQLPSTVLEWGIPAATIVLRDPQSKTLIQWDHRSTNALMGKICEVALQHSCSVYPTHNMNMGVSEGAVLALYPYRITKRPIVIQYSGKLHSFLPRWLRGGNDKSEFP